MFYYVCFQRLGHLAGAQHDGVFQIAPHVTTPTAQMLKAFRKELNESGGLLTFCRVITPEDGKELELMGVKVYKIEKEN